MLQSDLQALGEGAGHHVTLLFRGQCVEAHGVAGDTDGQLRVLFRVGDGVFQGLATQDVDVQVLATFDSRLGFSYTETRGRVFNREVLYGIGYRLTNQWSVAMEHRYDFEFDELRTQTYEVRRIWDCWETAIRFRDRESGFDINFEISLTALPGTKLKL